MHVATWRPRYRDAPSSTARSSSSLGRRPTTFMRDIVGRIPRAIARRFFHTCCGRTGPCRVDASSPYPAVGVFVIVGYLTLINSWVRNALVGLLSAFRREAQ